MPPVQPAAYISAEREPLSLIGYSPVSITEYLSSAWKIQICCAPAKNHLQVLLMVCNGWGLIGMKARKQGVPTVPIVKVNACLFTADIWSSCSPVARPIIVFAVTKSCSKKRKLPAMEKEIINIAADAENLHRKKFNSVLARA